jgi:dipeptidyl aminopeptidase/acylaminoacyl peptidase
MMRSLFVALAGLAILNTPANAQGTAADYDRAEKLGQRFANKVTHAKVDPHWAADDSGFWFRSDTGAGTWEFIRIDTAATKREPAFDHAKLAAALSTAADRKLQADHLPLENLDLAPDGSHMQFDAEGSHWKCDLASYTLEKSGKANPAPPAPDRGNVRNRRNPGQGRTESRRNADSPDGKWTTLVKNGNLVLKEKASGEEFPLSKDASNEEGYEQGVYWAPDSKHFAALRTRKAQEHPIYTVESSPKDQLQPKLHTIDYLKPGDRIAVTKPHLFDAAEHKEIPVKDDLFATPWSITQLRWAADSSRFTFLYNQRGHQAMRIVAVDAATGDARAIVNEEVKTFIDYTNKVFTRYITDSNEIIWMSERDGWNHLHLYDGATGAVKNQITKGEWVVRGVERVDEKARQIFFRASGIIPGQDPYYIHYCRINFDGSGLVMLTQGDGTHRIDYSPGGKYFLDTYSRVDLAPVTELRRAEDGKLLCEVERGDTTALAEAGWHAPERFVAKGRDGVTDIYGVIHRPINFDENKKYPIIEDIYAGPQGSFVPKNFASYFPQQALAELGFIVVQIDGMGTNNRSKAFHDVCFKNLADAGFPDRILWVKAAAAKYPYMDLTKVGLYGTSAGGQSALGGLLFHGDFYKAAVSNCGCHDNRMDKIWWNEQWMSYPVGPEYAASSNVVNTKNLTGKLLLFVGELDTNVDPASTMQVVNALIKANKDFDLVVFPGAGHGQVGAYGQRRLRDFFVRNLLGVEPRRG